MIVVVITAQDVDRVREGLRAGLGLGLRDRAVEVVITDSVIALGSDPAIARALGTLEQLGRPARIVAGKDLDDLLDGAHAVEFWGPAVPVKPRQLVVGQGGQVRRLDLQTLDNHQLVREILSSDAAHLH